MIESYDKKGSSVGSNLDKIKAMSRFIAVLQDSDK